MLLFRISLGPPRHTTADPPPHMAWQPGSGLPTTSPDTELGSRHFPWPVSTASANSPLKPTRGVFVKHPQLTRSSSSFTRTAPGAKSPVNSLAPSLPIVRCRGTSFSLQRQQNQGSSACRDGVGSQGFSKASSSQFGHSPWLYPITLDAPPPPSEAPQTYLARIARNTGLKSSSLRGKQALEIGLLGARFCLAAK